MLAAKAATVAALVFPVALVCRVVGFGLGQQILAGEHLQVAFSHPGVTARSRRHASPGQEIRCRR